MSVRLLGMLQTTPSVWIWASAKMGGAYHFARGRRTSVRVPVMVRRTLNWLHLLHNFCLFSPLPRLMFLKTDSSNHKQWAEEDFTHSLVGNGLGGGGGTACFQSSRPEKTLNGLIVQMQKNIHLIFLSLHILAGWDRRRWKHCSSFKPACGVFLD